MTRRKSNTRYWCAAVALTLLLFVLSERRANTYRKCIYLYEGMQTTNNAQMRAEIERYIGRPNCDIYRLPVRPRYKHFWDDYNVELHNWSE